MIFDFDGVLIESEYVSNVQIAEALSALGHPTTVRQALDNFVGLGGKDFLDAVEGWIGGPIPEAFHTARKAEDERVVAQGLDAVAGAVAFVRTLPADFPIAIASSSTTRWIDAHLRHIGLIDNFAGRIFSGREHVERGKPAPDIYLHAAKEISIPIERVVILEDSPVGVTGAIASGATVIGLAAGRHCADGHDKVLSKKGAHFIAHDFDEVVQLIA